MAEHITWTVYPFHKSEKGYVWHETRTYATKRQAVVSLNSRKAKSAIVRVGHTYYVEMEQ